MNNCRNLRYKQNADADFTMKVLLILSSTEDLVSFVTLDVLSNISVTKALGQSLRNDDMFSRYFVCFDVNHTIHVIIVISVKLWYKFFNDNSE